MADPRPDPAPASEEPEGGETTAAETSASEESKGDAPPAKAPASYTWLGIVLVVVIVAQLAWLVRSVKNSTSGPSGRATQMANQGQPGPRGGPPPLPGSGRSLQGAASPGVGPPPQPGASGAPGGPAGPVGGPPPGGGFVPRVPPSPGVGPPPPPGGAGGSPAPPTGPRGMERSLDFQEFAGVLMLMEDARIPLTEEQRAKALELVNSYLQNARKVSACCHAISNVLTPEQRNEMLTPRPPLEPPPTPLGPGRFYSVENLVARLEEKAGAQGATPQAAVDTGQRMPLDRFTVVNGLTALVAGNSLSAEQARTALDNVKIIRDELFAQKQLEDQLASVLTSEQKGAVSRLIPRDTLVTAWLLTRHLDRK